MAELSYPTSGPLLVDEAAYSLITTTVSLCHDLAEVRFVRLSLVDAKPEVWPRVTAGARRLSVEVNIPPQVMMNSPQQPTPYGVVLRGARLALMPGSRVSAHGKVNIGKPTRFEAKC